MKILLINNNTKHLNSLTSVLAGHDFEIQLYHPKLKFHDEDKDLVILSGGGGEGFEIDDKDKHGKLWYEKQMQFIKQTSKPVIGICMGFEVMAKTHGQLVPELGKTVSQTTNITTTKLGWGLFGRRHSLRQFESHSWHVPQTPKGFLELARSEYGSEMIYSPKLRQIGTQFHPELSGTLRLNDLIQLITQ